MEAYYYNQLSKAGQTAYHAMLTGLGNLAPSFQVPLLGGKELACKGGKAGKAGEGS